jgi:hypothetical protein
MTDDHTLQPIFARVNYTLTITAAAGGTTNPAPGTYTHSGGTVVQVTAMPNSGYRFDHWVLDGSPAGSANPISVLMNSSHTLQAVFAETHTLVITVSDGGTTNPPPGTYVYNVPTYVTVTAIPYTNYRFDHWVYDGENIGSANPVTVYAGSSHTLKAVFVYSVPPVGGYAVSFTKPAWIVHLTSYTLLLAFFSLALSLVRRKRK